MSKIDLYKGDCLTVMDELIAEGVKIGITVTSPPYDNLRDYNNSLQWNETIWKNIISKLYSITDNDGIVVWVIGDATINGSETGTSFKQALYFMECGFKLHDTMIYEKNSSTFPARATSNRYTQIFEYMFVFAKGKVPKQLICDKPNRWAGHKDYSGKLKNPVPDFSPRTNIFRYITSKGKTGIHDAPFPEQLVEDMLISFAKKGDTVFDCFMGSGTTGKIAKKKGFDFKGIEKVPEYFDIAKKRIEDAVERTI
jgi:DNA modification methylase